MRQRPAVRDRASEPTTSSFRRPIVEPAVPRPIGLDAGHEPRPTVFIAQPRRKPSSPLFGLICNGAVVVFALVLVLAASRRRRSRVESPILDAEVLQLPRPASGHRRVSRAA